MLTGFRAFILRGNIVELAIAVVIGSAFAALVTAFTKSIISPIIAVFGGSSVDGLAFYLNKKNVQTLVDFGALLTAVITFLITAAVVYFVFVVPMNRLNAVFKKGQEETLEAAPTELQLLIEIRDLLRAQNPGEAADRADADPIPISPERR